MSVPWNKGSRVRVRASKDVASAEDWNPTTNGLIHVTLYEYRHGDMWRVVVRGDDDTVMELDVFDEQRARYVFDRVVHLTTKDELRRLGLQFC